MLPPDTAQRTSRATKAALVVYLETARVMWAGLRPVLQCYAHAAKVAHTTAKKASAEAFALPIENTDREDPYP